MTKPQTPRRRAERDYAILSPQHMQAIALFATGHSYADVAREIGVSVSTLYGWRVSRTFKAAVKATHTDRLEFIKSEARRLAAKAFAVLEESMDPHLDPRTRVKAAIKVLDTLERVEVPPDERPPSPKGPMRKIGRKDPMYDDDAALEALPESWAAVLRGKR